MITIYDSRPQKTCAGLSRRHFLQIGSLGFGGLSLSSLLASKSLASPNLPDKILRNKSVVFLFLQGGPSHIECFDPKMSAPVEFRSITGEVQTKTSGITFGGTFPQLAKLSDRLSIVRSYGSKNGGHTYQAVASGGNQLKATMGALYARVAGNTNPRNGIPNNTLILPEAVDPALKLGSNFETGALPTLTASGELGPNYLPFNPQGGGTLKENMQLKLPAERFDDRKLLLSTLDRFQQNADSGDLLAGFDEYQQQAFDVILKGVAKAFDLEEEDPKTIEKYDTSKLFSNSEVQRWGDMRRSTNLLGKQMLLARRLCEAGCGFVTVSDCGWDMHSNGNSPKNLGGMYWLGPQVDHAVAAFIEDVEERGLSEDILLVVTGEMGRTPRINKNGGRDHYGDLTPLLFSGGGLEMGSVIGHSDRQISKPVTFPYTPRHMLDTILGTLIDTGLARIQSQLPREITTLFEELHPITELL